MFIKTKLLLISILITTGCANTKPPKLFQPTSIPNGKAIIYLYRVNNIAASVGAPKTLLNGKKLKPLINGTYQVLKVNPGLNEIQLKGNIWTYALPDEKLVMKTVAGKHYFARYSAGLGSVFFVGNLPTVTHSANLRGVKKDIAIKELSYLMTEEELDKILLKEECENGNNIDINKCASIE